MTDNCDTRWATFSGYAMLTYGDLRAELVRLDEMLGDLPRSDNALWIRANQIKKQANKVAKIAGDLEYAVKDSEDDKKVVALRKAES